MAKGTASQQAGPRYITLASELVSAIRSGRYVVGSDLPTEAEMQAAYGVSRFTVREALRQVEQAGLIRRRQGSGSRVTARTPPSAYTVSLASETDILRYSSETLVSFRKCDGPIPPKTIRELNLGSPTDWVWVSGIRKLPDGRAIALTDGFIRSKYRAILKELDGPLADRLFTRVAALHNLRMSHIDQLVAATLMPSRAGRRLASAAGSPALRITRWYVAHDAGTIAISVSLHPADRFQYALRLERSPSTAVSSRGRPD